MNNKEFKYFENFSISDEWDKDIFIDAAKRFCDKHIIGDAEIEFIQTNSSIHEFQFRFNELTQLFLFGMFYQKEVLLSWEDESAFDKIGVVCPSYFYFQVFLNSINSEKENLKKYHLIKYRKDVRYNKFLSIIQPFPIHTYKEVWDEEEYFKIQVELTRKGLI